MVVPDIPETSRQDLGASFARGLDTVTGVIYETEDVDIGKVELLGPALSKYTGTAVDLSALSIAQRNRLLATMVRQRCVEDGFLSGWACLVEAAPNMGLDPNLVKDVRIAGNVYETLKTSPRSRGLSDIKMSIGPQATYDSIYRIGPKSLGGTAWRASEEYNSFLKNPAWSDAGYSRGIPPCVAIGWIGIQMKTTPVMDGPEVVRLQLLGTVDFDLDLEGTNQLGFQRGFDSAKKHTRAVGTKLQGAAMIGMLNYDLQNYIRPIQNEWAAGNYGPFNLGPAQISPQDWAAYLVADCAALVPFAYDRDYNQSRVGMVNGMIHLQCQDLIFDTGCSNRVATVPYAEAAGVAQYGIHAAYAVAAREATAQYFLEALTAFQEDTNIPPFGYAACTIAGVWGPFGTRYRVWERCVKYMRQLKLSDHPEAKALIKLCSSDMMLKDYELQEDVGNEWARAMNSNASDVIPRPFDQYFVSVIASDLFGIPGVDKPSLCAKCGPVFDVVMASGEKEEVHAAAGIPRQVTLGTFGRPASLAAGFRRATLFGCSEDCCDVCASRIGFWADAAAYSVLSALMHDEPLLGPTMWMLQNYFVGCISLWPIGVSFLLSGFDLLAELSFDDGAMGARDVVDC